MLPTGSPSSPICAGFQSSPAPRRGCCFNDLLIEAGLPTVSILTRAEARVLRAAAREQPQRSEVSILTRAEARVLHFTPFQLLLWAEVSILTRAEARVLLNVAGVWHLNEYVSILTRAEARVLPGSPHAL